MANLNHFLYFLIIVTVKKFCMQHLDRVGILPDKIEKNMSYVVHETLKCTYDCNSVKSWQLLHYQNW